MCGAANPLDKVVESNKLPVARCVNYKENDTGSCWYDSVAFSINKDLAEGKINLDQLKLKTKGPRVAHPEVRAAVCNFVQSDDCIMKQSWINDYFKGDKKRWRLLKIS